MNYLASLLLVTLAPVATTSHARTMDSSDAIRRVLEDYIVGWREGDSAILSRVFELDNGYVIWVGEGAKGGPEVDSMSFRDIGARGKAAGPSYGTEVDIVTIDVTDDTVATAKLVIAFDGGTYVDHLTLYKVGESWKIVAKTFAVRRH